MFYNHDFLRLGTHTDTDECMNEYTQYLGRESISACGSWGLVVAVRVRRMYPETILAVTQSSR